MSSCINAHQRKTKGCDLHPQTKAQKLMGHADVGVVERKSLVVKLCCIPGPPNCRLGDACERAVECLHADTRG